MNTIQKQTALCYPRPGVYITPISYEAFTCIFVLRKINRRPATICQMHDNHAKSNCKKLYESCNAQFIINSKCAAATISNLKQKIK